MNNWLFSLVIFFSFSAAAQDAGSSPQNAPKIHDSLTGRKWIVGAGTFGGYGGSFVFLSQAWYKDYPRSSFHTFNDNGEWLQMDKIGHAWTAYHTSRVTTDLWRWAGVPANRAMLYGTGSSLLYMLSIEYLDGRSAEWGWSWGDAGADLFGAALFAGQEHVWGQQRIGIKFSSHYKNYEDAGLKKRANNLFGSSLPERLLKDYNAQSYWLSANIKSFFPKSALPSWLNIAAGYSAEGMFGGYENLAHSKTDGSVIFDRRDIPRYRQFYLAPDVDFTKIKTRSRILKAVFSALNVLKCPAPALALSNGKLQLKAVVF